MSFFSLPSVSSLSSVSKILDFNPQLSTSLFPPQVQIGIKAFNQAAGVAGQFGIKIPTSDDLLKMANGEIDKVLGGIKGSDIYKQASQAVTKILAGADANGNIDPQKLLNSIDWLL
jgi:hypothetical protein